MNFLAEEAHEWMRQRRAKGLGVPETTSSRSKKKKPSDVMALVHSKGTIKIYRNHQDATLPVCKGAACGYDIWAIGSTTIKTQ